ncbi:MAG: hypothetical protein ACRD6X_02585 [Pyrinomonadaceae bacterium]
MTRLILILIGISLFGSADIPTRNEIFCSRAEQTACRPCLRPDSDPDKMIENKWPDVTALELDKTELRLPPPNEGSPPTYPDYSRDLTIGVKTKAADPEGDVLVYIYTVSGGRIIGTGANVTWDLNQVLPGTYTVTAAVDDGCGACGAKMTLTVTVLENESAPACVCPKITIDATHLKERSSERVFGAYLTGPEMPNLIYDWTISEGTINSGQGTRLIAIQPSGNPSGQPITVTVEVSGLDTKCECPTTASRTFRY